MEARSLEVLPNKLAQEDGSAAPGIPIPPLAVSGLVVSRAALVAGLRLYVPQLVTLEPLEHGQFLLKLAGADREDVVGKETVDDGL